LPLWGELENHSLKNKKKENWERRGENLNISKKWHRKRITVGGKGEKGKNDRKKTGSRPTKRLWKGGGSKKETNTDARQRDSIPSPRTD